MDGVIADFVKRFRELYRISPDQAEDKNKFGKYFDHFIDTRQFATLDMMPDAKELLSYLNNTEVPVEILSSTGNQENYNEIAYQKEQWLGKHNINYFRNFVPGKALKCKFADANSIIIDDTRSVIDDWKKVGGTPIHHTDALTTIGSLDALLRG